ncbi:undecaprenyl-phosphate glucose phosphotransferase [Rhodovibrionaceae bacterium A322]
MEKHTTDRSNDREFFLLTSLRIGDVVVAVLSGYLAYLLRGSPYISGVGVAQVYWVALIIGGLLTGNVMQASRVYRVYLLRSPLQLIVRTTVAWLVVLLILATLAVLTKTSFNYSRVWFVLWAVMGLAGFLILRVALAALVARWARVGRLQSSALIIGDSEFAHRLADRLQGDPRLHLVGLVGCGESSGRGPQAVGEQTQGSSGTASQVVGELTDLQELIRRDGVSEVFVALRWGQSEVLAQVMQAVKGLDVEVHICLDTAVWNRPLLGWRSHVGVPMLGAWRRPFTAWERTAKAIEDRTGAFFLLLLFSPLLLAVAILIKLDSKGPVFFRQQRAGYEGKSFSVFKFRTMRVQQSEKDQTEVTQATKEDPRVTRVGRFLRRTSIDELPQLLNVLNGEMSLVGPRPHAVEHEDGFARQASEYIGRYRVKPGITGWAQIQGFRGEVDDPDKIRRRVEADLYYIDNWSLFLDIKILFITPFVAFFGENAY